MDTPLENNAPHTHEKEDTEVIYTIDPNECTEYTNLQYKSLWMFGTPIAETKMEPGSIERLTQMMDTTEQTETMAKESWNRLNKTFKMRKMIDYATTYCSEKGYSAEEKEAMIQFLKHCLDKKKLQRVKEVIYDKETGVILSIPALTYVQSTRHFTLRNVDHTHVSTMKSLTPKKAGSSSSVSTTLRRHGGASSSTTTTTTTTTTST